MTTATKKQVDLAFDEGRKAALRGDPSTPAPFDDRARGWAWIAGYEAGRAKSQGVLQQKKVQADARAQRIASIAAEELIRTECEMTGPNQYLMPVTSASIHERECIAHLCWLGKAISVETEAGDIVIIFGDYTLGAPWEEITP